MMELQYYIIKHVSHYCISQFIAKIQRVVNNGYIMSLLNDINAALPSLENLLMKYKGILRD